MTLERRTMGPDRAAANGSPDIPPPDQGVQHQQNHPTQPDMGEGASSAFAKNAPPRSDGELCSTEVWGHPRTAD